MNRLKKINSVALTVKKKYEYLEGKRFGQLIFLRLGKSINYRRYAWFKCDCGREKEMRLSDVKFGTAKSCCRRWISNLHHGLARTRIYQIWLNMKRRVKSRGYNAKYYLNRGIKVCDRWLICKNFMDDMLESYEAHVKKFGEKETEIDRIDNNKGYEPSNCRWVTQKEQWQNRGDKRIKNLKK